MRAVYLKEIKSYYNSMPSYIFMTIFLLAGGLFFTINNLIGDSTSLIPVLDQLQYILMLITPVLTVRLFVKERCAKTDVMLMTAPISVGSVVAGKFFSALSVFAITLVITMLGPLLIMDIGTFSWGVLGVGYAGLLLFGGALIAVGMFASAISKNEIAAVVITLGAMLSMLLLESIIPMLATQTVKGMLMPFTLSYNSYFFQMGFISLASVIYYLSIIFLFLFMTAKILLRSKCSEGGRS